MCFLRLCARGAVLRKGAFADMCCCGCRLKLKLYRSLGIDLEADAQGQFSRAVVRSAQKGLVNVIPIDSSLPRTAYADRIWGAL